MSAVASRTRGWIEEGRFLARSMGLSRRLRVATAERRARYAGQQLGFDTERVGGRPLRDIIAELDRRGFVVLEDVFAPEGLAELAAELRRAQAADRMLPIDRGTLEPGAQPYLAPEEVELGEQHVSRLAHITYVRDPFIDCPSARRYAFSDEIIDLAAAAYGCPASLVAGKLMKSYVNDLPRYGFYLFHSDSQAARNIKFFLYLHDVDEDAGPFCYVEGSHRRLPRAIRTTPFLTDRFVEDHYGADAIVPLTARAGSLVVANTVGLHRAGKPHKTERQALLIAAGVHAWPARVRLCAADLERASPKQRAMADLAELV